MAKLVRVKARAEFPVTVDGVRLRATPGVVFELPPRELSALVAAGLVEGTSEPVTPADAWPEPPNPATVTEVDRHGKPVRKLSPS